MGAEVSGHSARRSGAMYYVRAGLPLQELAFLGRWKSNVVLSCAEEALQEKAVRVPRSMEEEEGLADHVLKELPTASPSSRLGGCPFHSSLDGHGTERRHRTHGGLSTSPAITQGFVGRDERKRLEGQAEAPGHKVCLEHLHVFLVHSVRLELCKKILRFLLCTGHSVGQAEVLEM